MYLSILENISGRFKFQENLTITDTLHEDQHITKGNDPLVICTPTEQTRYILTTYNNALSFICF